MWNELDTGYSLYWVKRNYSDCPGIGSPCHFVDHELKREVAKALARRNRKLDKKSGENWYRYWDICPTPVRYV